MTDSTETTLPQAPRRIGRWELCGVDAPPSLSEVLVTVSMNDREVTIARGFVGPLHLLMFTDLPHPDAGDIPLTANYIMNLEDECESAAHLIMGDPGHLDLLGTGEPDTPIVLDRLALADLEYALHFIKGGIDPAIEKRLDVLRERFNALIFAPR